MKPKLLAALALLIISLACGRAAAWYGSNDGQASSVRTEVLYLDATTHVLETVNPQSGSDTVMHLWEGSFGGGTEVAMNDDYNGLGSRIVYTPTAPGWYTLVVRSYNNGYDGTCDVKKDGDYLEQGAYFGGWHVGLVGSMTDVAQTVLATGGVEDTVLFALDSSGFLKAIDDDSGVGYASKLTGSYYKVVVGTYGGGAAGDSRLVINDAGNDNDGDGLGAELELALCICDAVQTWPCNIACDYTGMRTPQDSDGDGIRDDWEVLGRDEDVSDPDDFPQHLPKWGASPVRKDLFVEIDWLDHHSLDYRLTQGAAQEMAAAFQASGTAASVQNRDGSDGIHVHIDSGVASTGTTYGAWGGATALAAPNYENPSYSEFVRSRRGVFKYGAATASASGGKAAYLVGFRTAYDEGLTAAHEMGHVLDLRHGGSVSAIDQNGKPHYKSLMNYNMATPTFSKGTFVNVPLNPTNRCEADGLESTERTAVEYLTSAPYDYLVEEPPNDGNPYWAVDWNRDGVFSPCTNVSRAAPNLTATEAGSPELGRYCKNRKYFPGQGDITNAAPADTPSVTRIGNRLVLAYRDDAGTIRMIATTADFSSCENVCVDMFSGCDNWPDSYQVATGSAAGGPAVAVHTVSGTEHLVVVWNHGTTLRYSVYQYYNGQIFQSVQPTDVPGATGAIYEASLGVYNGDTVLLYRKGTPGVEGSVYANTMPSTGTAFSASQVQLRDEDGQTLTALSVLGAAAHPGGLRAVYGYWVQDCGPTICIWRNAPKWRDYAGAGR